MRKYLYPTLFSIYFITSSFPNSIPMSLLNICTVLTKCQPANRSSRTNLGHPFNEDDQVLPPD